jgi:hypothetical protein
LAGGLGRGWGWRELKEANKLLAGRNTQKRHQKRQFPALYGLKVDENAVFFTKVINKIYSQVVF